MKTALIVFGVLCVLAVWSVRRFVVTSRREEAEAQRNLEMHREYVRSVFAEIAECFARHGFTFKFAVEDGEHVGRTTPTSSGGYIEIAHYFDDDYMISMCQEDLGDATASYDQQARGAIHQRIELALIYNRPSQHFLRQHLPTLKNIGIEQVVASLVGLHQKYDAIWLALEDRGIRNQIVMSLESYIDRNARIMHFVDLELEVHQKALQ